MKFVFSDEAGEVRPENYYFRSAVVISEEKYFTIQSKFFKLKDKYGIPADEELKTSDVWYLKRYQEDGRPLPRRNRERLKKYTSEDYKYYLKFIIKSLKLLPDDTAIIAVWTYFFNKVFKKQDDIERDFLQTIMLRVEDELKERGERGIMLYDQIQINKLSKYYHKIFTEGKFIKKYCHIKDSIAFEVSTFSSGIQIVDYVANVVYNSLRGYPESLKLFKEILKSKIRRERGKSVLQTGFIPLYLSEYRKNQKGQKLIDKTIKNLDLNIIFSK